jgi:hypothetical protein
LELYYSAHGYYPYEGAAAYDLTDYKIPMYWTEMIRDLNDENFIKATLANDDIDKGTKFLTLINKAYAAVGGPTYYSCSLQDPLYRTADDYLLSYAYLPEQAVDFHPKSYKIRIKLERANNQALANSITGAFWGNSPTGETACDTSLGYYCMSETK